MRTRTSKLDCVPQARGAANQIKVGEADGEDQASFSNKSKASATISFAHKKPFSLSHRFPEKSIPRMFGQKVTSACGGCAR